MNKEFIYKLLASLCVFVLFISGIIGLNGLRGMKYLEDISYGSSIFFWTGMLLLFVWKIWEEPKDKDDWDEGDDDWYDNSDIIYGPPANSMRHPSDITLN